MQGMRKNDATSTRQNNIKGVTVCWAVVVAQLVERSHPTPEIRSLYPVIGKMLSTNLSTKSIIEKTKIKKTRPGIGHLLKKMHV